MVNTWWCPDDIDKAAGRDYLTRCPHCGQIPTGMMARDRPSDRETPFGFLNGDTEHRINPCPRWPGGVQQVAPTMAVSTPPPRPERPHATGHAPRIGDILAAIDALGPSSRDAITDYLGAGRAVVLDLVTSAVRDRLVHFTSDGYALTVDGRFRHNLNLSKASKH